jgi:hypothetical protein
MQKSDEMTDARVPSQDDRAQPTEDSESKVEELDGHDRIGDILSSDSEDDAEQAPSPGRYCLRCETLDIECEGASLSYRRDLTS